MDKITFRSLSWPLKTVVVWLWVQMLTGVILAGLYIAVIILVIAEGA